ncbi:MAG: hypothetical protein WCK01_03300 [Candidatus Uhrbacteria bacterium]
MIWRILVAALAGLMAGLFEVAVSPFLPYWADIRPLIPLVAILTVTSSRSRSYTALAVGSLVIEAYAISSPDAPLFRYLVVAILMDVVARRLLTNRSVYATAALAVFGGLIAWLLSLIVSGTAIALGFADGPWSPQLFPLFTLIWDIGLTSVAFISVAAFTGRFRL